MSTCQHEWRAARCIWCGVDQPDATVADWRERFEGMRAQRDTASELLARADERSYKKERDAERQGRKDAEEEVRRLSGLVKDALVEGYAMGHSDGIEFAHPLRANPNDPEGAWDDSDAKEAAEAKVKRLQKAADSLRWCQNDECAVQFDEDEAYCPGCGWKASTTTKED